MTTLSADSARELTGLARSGSLNLLGSVAAAVLTLAFMVVLNEVLGLATAGAVVSIVALFQVVATAATLGVDTGLVRTISGRHANEGYHLRSNLIVALVPVIAVAGSCAVAGLALAPRIGQMLGDGRLGPEVATFVRMAAPFVLASSLSLALLGATRGYGTMRPTVFLERTMRPGLQVAAVLVLSLAGASLAIIALGWAVPYVIAFVGGGLWLRMLHGRDTTKPREVPRLAETAREFWRFTLPRSFGSSFRVALQWLDVVFVGALASPEAAIIYGVATRLLQFGLLAAFSVAQAIEPRLGTALSQNRPADALELYRVATAWLILLTWPLYIVVTLFAPAILSLFGQEFIAGSDVVTILVASVLFGAAAGPVDILLLMAGKSSWSLGNTAASLIVNVALNLLLIPGLGIAGAAVAWTASRIVGNALPLLQTVRGLDMQPFNARWLRAIALTGGIFGALGLVVRLALGSTSMVGLVVVASLGSLILFLVLRQERERFQLDALITLLPGRKAPA